MRYRSLNRHLREKFGIKVYKISVDIDVTCPNRDGTLGFGGCIYCNPNATRPARHLLGASIEDQIKAGISYARKRHKADKFIAYFQNYSSTYGAAAALGNYYQEAIENPHVVGLAISTRPDCLNQEILDILTDLGKKTYLWVELGLQSSDDEILRFLNRGHTVAQFLEAAEKLHNNNIELCAHVILGLPMENETKIKETANIINSEGVEGVKIHNLHVLKGTKLENLYKEKQIDLISLEEYSRRVVLLLEHLSPNVLIHRFNSHAPRELTVAPDWSVNKLATFNAVENELKRKDSRQGKSYNPLS